MSNPSKWVKPILDDFENDKNGTTLQFEGNPLLRQKNTPIELTREHLNEIKKCKRDYLYFIKNYLKVIHVDHGKIPFNLYDYQESLLDNIHTNRYTCNMLSRQCGKTASVSAYIIWYTLFQSYKTVGILANRLDLAKEILDRAQQMYMTLPKWLQQGLVSFAKTKIEFENGSRVVVDSTSGSAGRGYVFNMLVLDEFAFTPDHIAADFMRSVFPTISSGTTTKMVMISTPKGMNHFHKYFVNGDNGKVKGKKGTNGYSSFRIEWHEVPGRDEKFRDDILKSHGQRYWNQEYDCQFLGSSDTLLTASAFQNMRIIEPYRYILGDLGRMFEEAKSNSQYILGCDVSHGDGNDNSSIVVWKVVFTNNPDGTQKVSFEQVFAWHDNDTGFYGLPTILDEIGQYYNNALIVVERNNIGEAVLHDLDKLHYDNIFGWDFEKGVASLKMGLRTNPATKNIGCNKLSKLIEANTLLIQDHHTYEEFNTFVKAKGSWQAEKGYHDDLVMANVVLAFATSVDEFNYYIEGVETFKETLVQRELRNVYVDLSDLYGIDNGADENWEWADESGEMDFMIIMDGTEEESTREYVARIEKGNYK